MCRLWLQLMTVTCVFCSNQEQGGVMSGRAQELAFR